MTRDEAITLLKGRLARPTDTTLDASIILEMRYVQEQMLEKKPWLPWFLLSDNITLTITPNVSQVAVPVNVGAVTGRDFLRETEDQGLWLKDTTEMLWKKLTKDDYNALYNYYEDTPGRPLKYSLDNAYFNLLPIPDLAYDLRGRFYLREPRLTSNIENGWLKEAADLVIAETGIIIAGSYLRDTEAEDKMRTAASVAAAQLLVTHEARMHAARDYSRGGDDN